MPAPGLIVCYLPVEWAPVNAPVAEFGLVTGRPVRTAGRTLVPVRPLNSDTAPTSRWVPILDILDVMAELPHTE